MVPNKIVERQLQTDPDVVGVGVDPRPVFTSESPGVWMT